jgi:hypothetical protein
MPAVGTCNTIPWNQTAYTYAARIPASFMDPANPMVDDIFFSSCTSNTWTAPDVQIALGHLPNPLGTSPFVFPQISGGSVTSLGSFQDLVVLWDSQVQGGFSWTYTQDTWSPLGFSAGGGTGFVWDGVRDVGFYVTMNGASGGSAMHRTGTEPIRVFTGGYQAASVSGSSAAGAKMSFTLNPSGPEVIPYGAGCALSSGRVPALGTNEIPSIGNAAFLVEISMASPGTTTYVFLALGAGSTPLGGGCDLLLDFPSMVQLINIGFSPFGPAVANGIGVATYPAPLPFDPGLSGARIWLQGAVLDATPLGFAVTNGLELGIF